MAQNGLVEILALMRHIVFTYFTSKVPVPVQYLYQYSTWNGVLHSAQYLRARVPGWVLEFRTMKDPRGSRSRTDMASSLKKHMTHLIVHQLT